MLKKFNFKNRKFLGILSIVLALLLVVGIVSIFNFSKPKEIIEIESSNFVAGKISSKGEFLSSDDYIITKSLINCDGLTIEPSYKAKSKFQVFFYDFDYRFVYCTEVLSEKYVFLDSVPFVEYCRIMILPDRDGKVAEDFKVNIFNKSRFVDEFKITTDKKQKVVPYKDYFEEDSTYENMRLYPDWSDRTLDYIESSGIGVSKEVDISNFSSLYFLTNKPFEYDNFFVCFVLTQGQISEHIYFRDLNYIDGFYTFRLDCSEGSSVIFNYSLDSECHLYLI